MNAKVFTTILLCLSLGGLTACNEDGMKSFGSVDANNGSQDQNNGSSDQHRHGQAQLPAGIEESIKDIDSDLSNADQAILDAVKLMDDLQSDGVLNVSSVEAMNQQVQDELSAQGLLGLSGKLDKVFDKAIDAITKAKGALGQARQKVQDALAKLDPNNPAHLPMIDKLNQLLLRMDEVENKFDQAITKLIDKVDHFMGIIDDQLANLQGPWAIPAYLLVEELRQSVERFKGKLRSL